MQVDKALKGGREGVEYATLENARQNLQKEMCDLLRCSAGLWSVKPWGDSLQCGCVCPAAGTPWPACSTLLSAANGVCLPFQNLCQLLWDQCWQRRLEHHHLCLRCPWMAAAYSWTLTTVFERCSSSHVTCIWHKCQRQRCFSCCYPMLF